MHLKILSSAKRPEIICALALSENIFSKNNFIVGDENEKLPDIYNIKKTHGIEVVQIERACDFKINRLWKLYEKYEGDYYKIKQECDSKYPNEYVLTEDNGKLVAFSTNEGAHRIDWMANTYYEEIYKKLTKLNNGNYSNISEKMDLCVSIIYRRKDVYDINLILYEYLKCLKNFTLGFDEIYIITSQKIFIIKPNQIHSITPIYWQNSIVDFEIRGNDYLHELEYNYNETIEKTNQLYDTQI